VSTNAELDAFHEVGEGRVFNHSGHSDELICTASQREEYVHSCGYARALKSRRQLRYAIRLSALLAELCRIVHR
jgi:hypothetical protein